MAWLRAFTLFGLLVAIPFLIEGLFGKNPRISLEDVKVGESFWQYSGFALIVFLFLGFLLPLLLFVPRAYQISEWLDLAERELNNLLRAWGGGFANRKDVVKERAEWLTMIPGSHHAALSDVYKQFFELNQKDLAEGGPQGGAMGKARMTAFLLREIYEGDPEGAQRKIFDQTRLDNGKVPFVAPGLWEILGMDDFDKDKGFPPGAGINWFPLWLTVQMYRFPRRIKMVKPGKDGAKIRVENWDVLEELTTPQG